MEALKIRIAQRKKPQPNGHRPFNDTELTLNQLKTKQEFLKEFIRRPDPYALKAIPHRYFKNTQQALTGGQNPFAYMSDYKLKTFCKYLERTEMWQRDEVDPVIGQANLIFLFKDVTQLTTSECLAMSLEFQERIRNTKPYLKEFLEDDRIQSEKKLHEATEIAREVIRDFKSHWEEYMDAIERPLRKRHTELGG